MPLRAISKILARQLSQKKKSDRTINSSSRSHSRSPSPSASPGNSTSSRRRVRLGGVCSVHDTPDNYFANVHDHDIWYTAEELETQLAEDLERCRNELAAMDADSNNSNNNSNNSNTAVASYATTTGTRGLELQIPANQHRHAEMERHVSYAVKTYHKILARWEADLSGSKSKSNKSSKKAGRYPSLDMIHHHFVGEELQLAISRKSRKTSLVAQEVAAWDEQEAKRIHQEEAQGQRDRKHKTKAAVGKPKRTHKKVRETPIAPQELAAKSA